MRLYRKAGFDPKDHFAHISKMVILGSGAAWLVYSTGMLPVAALAVGVLIFLPGDAVKACAAYLIAQRLP